MSERVLAPTGLENLMPYMVRDILLVASAYDCFVLEEDGRFSDRMLQQYVSLELSSPPHFQHVSTARQALDQLRRHRYDLVLCTPHVAGTNPRALAARIKHRHPETPVVLLTYDRAEALRYTHGEDGISMDGVFLWTGDPKLLVALVKSIEDERNAANDTRACMVRVIIAVEDDPAFYSAFLPELYQAVLRQCHALLPDRLNERDRRFRMRARPKILLANNFEQASHYYRRYKNNLLGIFTDMSFPRKGKNFNRSGLALVRKVRKQHPEMPIMIHSWDEHHRATVEQNGVYFAHKRAENLFDQVSDFMMKNFGFGAFVFRNSRGEEVDRAENLDEMRKVLQRVPGEVLYYHAARNHISNWLMARGEFKLAAVLQPLDVAEFETIEAARDFLLDSFALYFMERQRGQVTDYPQNAGLLTRDFIRVGSGSMGGKARGSAFLAHLLANNTIAGNYSNVLLTMPRSAVICTDYFDRFCAGDMRSRALAASDDEEVKRLFLEKQLPEDLMHVLGTIVAQIHYPLAVRSSSLLEDASFQPLAGLYDTYMLPNNDARAEIRLHQLSVAVRLVMASAFFQEARRHLRAHNFRQEREKMAVIVQRVVGRKHEHYFYPDIAGVAQSYNYYPMRFLKPEDGIATVALGLGKTVVEGLQSLRFSPKHPQILPQMSTTAEALRCSQRTFYALDLSSVDEGHRDDPGLSMVRLTLADAERHGTLEALGATYNHENNSIYDTIYRNGTRLVNFAGVLKFDRFPLSSLLRDLLALCEEAMGGPVEIEFAVTLGDRTDAGEMALLELRPLSGLGHDNDVELKDYLKSEDLLLSGKALGNGISSEIKDLLYIHPSRLKLSTSRQIAKEIERFNYKLSRANRPYVLIGPGRWGTSDPWMGVPVVWSQVSGARAIVELELPNSNIEPSLGTHFFHNLSALRVGYFCLRTCSTIDHTWLESRQVIEETMGICHLRLDEPLEIRIDGRIGEGLILKKPPQKSP